MRNKLFGQMKKGRKKYKKILVNCIALLLVICIGYYSVVPAFALEQTTEVQDYEENSETDAVTFANETEKRKKDIKDQDSLEEKADDRETIENSNSENMESLEDDILEDNSITETQGEVTDANEIETQNEWEKSLKEIQLSGICRDDVLKIAESQLGYRESIEDYIIEEDGEQRGYSSYGAWYGEPYGEWSAMFVSFCLDYAGVKDYPLQSDPQKWLVELGDEKCNAYLSYDDYEPKPGDLVFFNMDSEEGADRVGIVAEVTERTDNSLAQIKTIEGDAENQVQYVTYNRDDPAILGYGILPDESKEQEEEFSVDESKEQEEEFSIETTTLGGTVITISGACSSLPFPKEELTFVAEEVEESEMEIIEENTGQLTRSEKLLAQMNSALEKSSQGIQIQGEALFDICLWHGTEEVEPVGIVTLSFSGIMGSEFTDSERRGYVYHIDENAECVEDMGAIMQEDGTLSVETNHFSVYGVVVTEPADSGEKMTANYASEKPGTIETVDSRSDGIKLNLFDYTAEDTWANKVASPRYTGINSGRNLNNLLFFGSGDLTGYLGDANDINCYTGGGYALQGIVNNTLSSGYPTLRTNNSSLKYLFDPSVQNNAKTVYENVNHLFQKDGDGYYRYDSNQNYAYYPDKAGGGDFTVYSSTYQTNAGDAAIGFFPFNDYDSNYRVVNPDSTHYNHHFGLTMNANFTIPKNMKINGNDMVFDFSGDDDVWVFIDDVLVLDIGGIHNATSGSINFTTGAVTVSGAKSANTSGSKIGTSSTLEQIFRNVGKNYDGSEYSEHTISFFYLERGGCYSNCKLSFNLNVYQKSSLTIQKIVKGMKSEQLQDQDFLFQLFLETNPGSDKYQLYTGEATYEDGSKVTYDADGVFRLKSGQKITVPQVIDSKKYYIKEVGIKSEQISEVQVNGKICQPQYDEDGKLYQIISPPVPVRNNVEVICSNITPQISVKKVWKSLDDSEMIPDVESISIELWRRYDKPVAPNSHTVQFNLMVTNNGVTTPYSIQSIEVVDGGSVSFATRLYGPPDNVTSTHATVTTNGEYPIETWANVPIYVISNIVQDEEINISFSGGVYDNQIKDLKFKIINYDQAASETTSEKQVDERVDTVTLNEENGWKYSWTNLQTDGNSGMPVYYYIKEVNVPGYLVSYMNNEGIEQGEITIINTKNTYTLPSAGGISTLPFILCGSCFIALPVFYKLSYKRKCKRGRRNGERRI